jgi:hypothetical protein
MRDVFFRPAAYLHDLQIAVTFEPPPTSFLQIGTMRTISAVRSRCATSELIFSTFYAARGAGDRVVGQSQVVQKRILSEIAFNQHPTERRECIFRNALHQPIYHSKLHNLAARDRGGGEMCGLNCELAG